MSDEMKLFSTIEAAEYLGKSVSTVRHHVYYSKRLHPLRIGGTLVFTQEELDRFKREHPGRPGRKRKES